ncbi:MAG TPA: disulfide bond formation protein B [Pirellulales bacterium]|jgi:disulfide bond formation protein DsbB
MSHRLGFWLAHLCILGVMAALVGGFVVQFAWQELPCPLCMLQRMGMILAAFGPAFILLRCRHGDVSPTDFATGYGMSIIAAMFGASVSTRHILLHIASPDPVPGLAVLGMHLYTWALIVFCTAIAASGLNLLFTRELAPRQTQFGWPTRLVLGSLAAVIVTNLVCVFFLEGFHWLLPGDPDRYQLLSDLARQ